MNKSILAAATAAAACVVMSSPAWAQFAKPEDAIKYRKAAFVVMERHMLWVDAMLKGKQPWDAKAVADNAELATIMSKLPYAAFIPGSDKGNTHAKPEVWSEPDKFRAAADRMQTEMAKLNAAAKTGNRDDIKSKFGTVAQACKSCHDHFRKD